MTTDPQKDFEEALVEALQMSWDDFCIDAGAIPDDIHVAGPPTTRVYAEFGNSNWIPNAVTELLADPRFYLKIAEEHKLELIEKWMDKPGAYYCDTRMYGHEVLDGYEPCSHCSEIYTLKQDSANQDSEKS